MTKEKPKQREDIYKDVPLVFAETVRRGLEALEGGGRFHEAIEQSERRTETLQNFFDFLGIEDSGELAQDIADNLYNVDEIVRIWERGGLAGLKLFLSSLKTQSLKEETKRMTEEEKLKDIREEREKPEDAEPEVSKTGKIYGEEDELAEEFLSMLIEKGLVENTDEAIEFWTSFLSEVKDIKFLIKTFNNQ